MADQRRFLKVSVKTDHPHPLRSPDYFEPAGSIEDNSSSQYFLYELQNNSNFLISNREFPLFLYASAFLWSILIASS